LPPDFNTSTSTPPYLMPTSCPATRTSGHCSICLAHRTVDDEVSQVRICRLCRLCESKKTNNRCRTAKQSSAYSSRQKASLSVLEGIMTVTASLSVLEGVMTSTVF